MSKYANRVRKIEVAKRGKRDPNWHVVDECGHALFGEKVDRNPDMRLVQPCDTDSVTYACIQVDIAYADYDEKLLNRYWSTARPPPPPPFPGESDWDYVQRTARCDPVADQAEKDREKRAIENARARVAAAKQAIAQRSTRESAQ